MEKIVTLSETQVKVIHQNQIGLYGGLGGIRDEGLLSSAVAQPHMTFDGKPLCDSVYMMAAMYMFGIAKNHAFFDGNKRTAAVATVVFLELNGIILNIDDEGLYNLVKDVVENRLGKEEIASIIELNSSLEPVPDES